MARCAGPVIATGTGLALKTAGIVLPVSDDTVLELSTTGMNAKGVRSTCSAGPTFVEDSAPPVFSGLQAVAGIESDVLRLTWAAAADTVSAAQAITYAVCRATTSDGCDPFQPSDTTAPGALSFDVSDLNTTVSYFFAVRARDAAGNEDNNTVMVDGRTCAAGYLFDGAACVWAGVVVDGGFHEDSAWLAALGAVVDVDHAGYGGDAGAATLDEAAIAAGGTLAQTVVMPAYADSELFVLQVYAYAECPDCPLPAAAVAFNGKWQKLQVAADTWTLNRLCLGEAAYDGAVELQLGHYTLTSSPNAQLDFDEVAILPAGTGECAALGAVVDPGFDVDGAWLFAGSGVAERQDVLSGYPKAYLETGGGTASATGRLSVPLAGIDALRFEYRGQYTTRLAVRLGDFVLGTTGDDGIPGEVQSMLCLPAWARGLAWNLTFEVVPSATSAEFWIDDVALGTGCTQADAALYDGDFEVAEFPSQGVHWRGDASGDATVRMTSFVGHGGSLGGSLSLRGRCYTATLETTVVPIEAAAKLQFWAMRGQTSLGSATLTVNGVPVTGIGTSYAPQTVCNVFAGLASDRAAPLRFVFEDNATCDVDTISIWLDTITVESGGCL